MSLDGPIGQQAVATLDADGRTGGVGTITWQLISLPGGADVTTPTTAGVIAQSGAAGFYDVAFNRPGPAGSYAIRWAWAPIGVAEESFETTGYVSVPGRATMAALIARVRSEIGDPAGASEQYTDADIQVALDEHQVLAELYQLTPAPTVLGGTTEWLVYLADLGFWEDGYTLRDRTFGTITADTNDAMNGVWRWTASQVPPVWISGTAYDLYAASADLLDRWAGSLARSFDWTADGQSMHLSQRVTQLRDQAMMLRRRALAQTVSAGDGLGVA